jgi:hypothetical protein
MNKKNLKKLRLCLFYEKLFYENHFPNIPVFACH